MANLKEIRTRIVSVNSTMQITSAMKMVSAAKLKRAQDAITKMRPYAEKLKDILENASASVGVEGSVYSQQREDKNVWVVAITSNRGLCGGFNNNVIKETRRVIAQHSKSNVKVVALGKKSADFFRKTANWESSAINDAPNAIFDQLNFENASVIAEKLMTAFAEGKVDKVVVIYNRFKNAAMQIVTAEQLLPVMPPQAKSDSQSNVDFIFEPSKEQIVSELIPRSLKVQLYKALLDSFAAEHGARMTAMHKATDNAGELVKDLKLTYNKARQAAITGEILEIVAGAEALNG
jgi:F-type H+-transporting ATPase subunit gamma